MNAAAWVALAPLLALLASLLLVMLLGAFLPRHRLVWAISLLGLSAALGVLPAVAARAPVEVTALLRYDAFAIFFTGLLLVAGLAIVLLSMPYLAGRQVHGEGHHREYYLLLLIMLTGALLLAASRHYGALFLGLELVSVALFALIAYPVQRWSALEAGIKYVMLSAGSSALLLFGIALIYAASGSLDYGAPIAQAMTAPARAGMLLVLVGLGFKLSLVPFHMWTPDVYEGAPAPVAALLAAVSKGAVAAALLQWLILSPAGGDAVLRQALALLAVLSMIAGNLLGLLQENVKRLLAYSSIGHMGFWLVPLAAAGPIAAEAAGVYLAAYVASVLAAFGVIAYLSVHEGEDLEQLPLYRGLFWHQPLASVVLVFALLSLAGIPLTVGFIAKFYVFAAGVEGARWGLVAVVALSSAIGMYYYLRVITTLFVHGAPSLVEPTRGRGVLLFLLLFIVAYGVMPSPLMDAVRTAVGGM